MEEYEVEEETTGTEDLHELLLLTHYANDSTALLLYTGLKATFKLVLPTLGSVYTPIAVASLLPHN